MGIMKKCILGALAIGAIGVSAACEPPPPPPPPPPKTPENLVSHAEYDIVIEGMTLADAERLLRKTLWLEVEASFPLGGGETYITKTYGYEGELGECYQYVSFTFDNADDDLNVIPGPLLLDSKDRSEVDCEGIVK